VDWAAGTITAKGGAAADLRTPSANIARPGAERRARAVAAGKLKAAVQTLSGANKRSEAQLEVALGRAAPASVDYQSNGGVLLSLRLGFADLTATAGAVPAKGDAAATATAAKTPGLALSVAAMPFELAPRVMAGDREAAVAWAVYRAGAPPAGVEAVAVKRDAEGRLALPKGDTKLLQKLAGVPVVIYVQKTSR
jgi:hypothetical protein